MQRVNSCWIGEWAQDVRACVQFNAFLLSATIAETFYGQFEMSLPVYCNISLLSFEMSSVLQRSMKRVRNRYKKKWMERVEKRMEKYCVKRVSDVNCFLVCGRQLFCRINMFTFLKNFLPAKINCSFFLKIFIYP